MTNGAVNTQHMRDAFMRACTSDAILIVARTQYLLASISIDWLLCIPSDCPDSRIFNATHENIGQRIAYALHTGDY